MVEAAHTLYREIHEQGEVVERAIVREAGPVRALADAVQRRGVALAMIVAREQAIRPARCLRRSWPAAPRILNFAATSSR